MQRTTCTPAERSLAAAIAAHARWAKEDGRLGTAAARAAADARFLDLVDPDQAPRKRAPTSRSVMTDCSLQESGAAVSEGSP